MKKTYGPSKIDLLSEKLAKYAKDAIRKGVIECPPKDADAHIFAFHQGLKRGMLLQARKMVHMLVQNNAMTSARIVARNTGIWLELDGIISEYQEGQTA